MTPDHYTEMVLIDISRMQREALALPPDTGETYDKDGKIVQSDNVRRCDTHYSRVRTERHRCNAEVSRNA